MDVRQPARTHKHRPLRTRNPNPEMRFLRPEIAHEPLHNVVLRTIHDMEREAADGFTANHRGQLVYEHPDTREAKYRKPLAVVDTTGRRPVIIVGGHTEHEGALTEMAEEIVHYGQDVSDYARRRERPDIQGMFSDAVEQIAANAAGKKTTGALPVARHRPKAATGNMVSPFTDD